jgi:hypothetical protein
MMKFFFFVLLSANAGLFAFHQGYLSDFIASDHEPARLGHQLNADKISLLSASAAAGAVAVSQNASLEKKPETIACIEVGNFLITDAKRFETQLGALALGDRQSRYNVQEVSSHMVYIPPQGSKEGADKKAGELRQLGVGNFFVIQDVSSPLHWGISLGIFKTEAAAQNQLATLNRQGVHSARIGTRSSSTNKLAFQLRNLDADAKARLDHIKADFPNQELRSCKKLGEANDNNNNGNTSPPPSQSPRL